MLNQNPVSLGDGYNFSTQEAVPKRLYKPSVSPYVSNCQTSNIRWILQEDHLDACRSMDVNAGIKLFVLSGSVEISGSSSFLKTNRSNARHCSFSLCAETFSHLESLDVENSNSWDEALIHRMTDEHVMSHVVAKVKYGAHCTLTCTYELSEAEYKSKLKANISSKLEKLAKWAVGNLSGTGDFNRSNGEKNISSKLSVSLHADVNIGDFQLPTSFDEALQTFKSIVPKLREHPRVVQFQIFPVHLLFNRDASVAFTIHESILEQCVTRLRLLSNMQDMSDNLVSKFSECANAFPSQYKQLQLLQELLHKEELTFKECIRVALCKVHREGHVKSGTILSEAVKCETHFRWKVAEYFIQLKKKECIWLSRAHDLLCTVLDDPFPQLQAFDTSSTSSVNISDTPILTFYFGSRIISHDIHPFLENSEDDDWFECDEEWINDEDLMLDVNGLLQTFINFATHNKNNHVNRITGKEDHDTECRVSHQFVRQLQNNERCNFFVSHKKSRKKPNIFLRMPGEAERQFVIPPPPILNAEEAVISHDHFSVLLPAATEKYVNALAYSVALWSGSKFLKEKEVKSLKDEKVTVSFFYTFPETEYSCQASAITRIGNTNYETIGVIRTMPAPPACCSITKYLQKLPKIKGKAPFYKLPVKSVVKEHKPGTFDRPERKVLHTVAQLENMLAVHDAADLYILCIGMTGTGKSTQINAIVNWLFGVREECNHRLVLIEEPTGKGRQSKSVTTCITIYTIPCFQGSRFRRTVHLVDTPGASDTAGVAFDEALVEMFGMLYSTIRVLHCVVFLTMAGNVRLTEEQHYVIGEATKSFGKELRDNFIILFTKSDGGQPPDFVLSELSKLKINLSNENLISTNNVPFTFMPQNRTSSSIPLQDLQKLEFESSMSKVSTLMKTASIMKARPTEESRNVVERRKDLIEVMESMDKRLCLLINQLTIIVNDFQNLRRSDPTRPEKVKKVSRKAIKKLLEYGKSTHCPICMSTCHENCTVPIVLGRSWCEAMKNGHCQVCPAKCKAEDHSVTDYMIEYEDVEEEEENIELFQRYVKDLDLHATKERALVSALQKYLDETDIIDLYITKMHEIHENLTACALNKIVLTPRQFLEKLHERAMNEYTKEAKQRATQLQTIMRQQDYAEKLKNGVDGLRQDDMLQMKEYLTSCILEINRMTSLSAEKYDELRSQKKAYSWCDGREVSWNNALDIMVERLEKVLKSANGLNEERPKLGNERGSKRADQIIDAASENANQSDTLKLSYWDMVFFNGGW